MYLFGLLECHIETIYEIDPQSHFYYTKYKARQYITHIIAPDMAVWR